MIHKVVSRAVQQVRQQSRRADKVSAPKPNLVMILDRDLVERLADEHHLAISSVPVSRNEYLDRRARLWSLIQGINPETANLIEIAAEKAALDAYERVAAEGEGVER